MAYQEITLKLGPNSDALHQLIRRCLQDGLYLRLGDQYWRVERLGPDKAAHFRLITDMGAMEDDKATI